MNTSSGVVEFIRLGSDAQHLSVVVLGRHSPGVLALHDILRAEIVVRTEIGTLRLKTSVAPSDVDDWDSALGSLADDEPVSWLGNRCPEIEIGPGDGSGFWHATVSDPGQSGVIVQIPVTIDEAGNRERLEALRRAYPREVISTSPGTYQWRSPGAGQGAGQHPQ
jgi:Family of unknown function (DUF5959)